MVLERVLNLIRGPPASPASIVVAGKRLKVKFQPSLFANTAGLGMGTDPIVWPATHALVEYLGTASVPIPGARVLELGSGLGLLGLSIAAMGARSVCLTDRLIRKVVLSDEGEHVTEGGEQILQALRNNVALNSEAIAGANVNVEELPFGNHARGTAVLAQHGPFDIIVGSDVTYCESMLPDLVNTIGQMCGRDTLVLLGHGRKRTGCEEAMFDMLAQAGLSAAVAHTHSDFDHGETIIVQCGRAG